MPSEYVEALTGLRVPHDQVPVEAGRDQPSAVRAERQRADGMVMSGKGAEALAGLRVPDPHAPAPAPRREAPAVATERHGHAVHHLLVRGEGVDRWGLAVPPVPDVHRPVTPRR